MTSLFIKNATLLPESQVVSILVVDGIIQSILTSDEIIDLTNSHVIDAQELILSPGFIELQINGGFGYDFTEDPASIWEVAEKLPRFGITSFLPTIITSPLETIERAIQVIQKGRPSDAQGAIALGLHLEGPFLNPARKGAHNPIHLRSPKLDLVENWSPENGVRLVTLAPELPGAAEVIQKLHRQGVVVSAGHSMATYDQAIAAFKMGVTYGTHLFNAMSPFEHRNPNLPGALLTTPGPMVGLIVDGIHAHPATIRLIWQVKGGHEITLVTDAMAALGIDNGLYHLGDYDVTVKNGSARLSDGTLAGSIVKPDEELRNLMAFTGCTLSEALPTFTSNPAKLLGLNNRGVIKPGAIADFVLLSPDGYIKRTVIQGEEVFSNT